MLKLNKMTDYAVVCLGMLARKPEYVMSASQISKETGLKLYTVQKILKNILAKSDLLKTERGYHGGYTLKKNSKNITVTEIIEALDGPISLTSCVDKSDSFCQSSDICFLGGKWNRVNEIIRNSLNDISLDDLLNFDNSFAIEHEKSRLKKYKLKGK
jgi:FeS assembly SUF system regulator